jgi:hypothetical protein
MSEYCAATPSSTLIGQLIDNPPAASAPESAAINSAAPSLGEVFRSSRVRAWVPQHLIDSCLRAN